MRKAWIAKNAARLRDRNSHREPGPDMDVDTPMADHGTGQHGVKEESYFGTLVSSIPVARNSSLILSVDSRDMPPPPIPPSHTPPPLLTPNNGSREGSTGQPLPPESLTSPSLPFSKLSLLSPVIPAPSAVSSSCPESLSSPNPNNSPNIPSTSKGNVTVSSTSASASKSSSTPGSKTSKPTARKPRRPTLAASTSRVDAKAAKTAKVTKARGKGKEKAAEKDKKATERIGSQMWQVTSPPVLAPQQQGQNATNPFSSLRCTEAIVSCVSSQPIRHTRPASLTFLCPRWQPRQPRIERTGRAGADAGRRRRVLPARTPATRPAPTRAERARERERECERGRGARELRRYVARARRQHPYPHIHSDSAFNVPRSYVDLYNVISINIKVTPFLKSSGVQCTTPQAAARSSLK